MRINIRYPKGRLPLTMSHGEKAMVMATMLNGYLSRGWIAQNDVDKIRALETKLQEYVGFRFID